MTLVSAAVGFALLSLLFGGLVDVSYKRYSRIANLSFVVSLGISVAMKMEAFTPRKGIAIACAGVSIFLLSRIA